jgi:hypothetical protein
MVELQLYENARQALAKLHKVDEVKDVRDKALALAEYAKQAKDTELIKHATEVKLRAERRVGELLIEMKPIRNSGREGGDRVSEKAKAQRATFVKQESFAATPANPEQPNKHSIKPKLFDLGVNKDQSASWQKLAKMPEPVFEAHVDTEKAKFDSRRKRDEERLAEEKAREEKRKVKGEKDDMFGGTIPNDNFTINTNDKTIILSIDNELQNRLLAMDKYLEKNIKDIAQIIESKEYLKFTVIQDYSARFLILGSKLIEFSKNLKSLKLVG